MLTPHIKSKKVLIVSDAFVKARYMPVVQQSLEAAGLDVNTVEVPTGEESKSLAEFSRIQDSLVTKSTRPRFNAHCLGWVGSSVIWVVLRQQWYMRGIPYVQIPTTLQAQVDASVGGKTAINHPKGKNLIGAFHQPKLVLIDVGTLETLSQRDIRAGLIEVIKMGVIRDQALFEMVEEKS